MAKIEYRLSARTQGNNRSEILIRVFHGSRLSARAKSRIFVSPDFFEYYIDRTACRMKGVKVPDKAITASLRMAARRHYILLERGELVVNLNAPKTEIAYHREQKRVLDSLANFVFNAFDTTRRRKLDSAWLEEQVDRFFDPSKYVDSVDSKKTPTTLVTTMEHFLSGIETRIPVRKNRNLVGKPMTKGTKQKYRTAYHHFMDYLHEKKLKDIPLAKLGKDFYDDFINYMNTPSRNTAGRAYAINTIDLQLKCLKAMINLLPASVRTNCEFVEQGKCMRVSEDVSNIALTEDELKILAEYPLEGLQARVRDYFLLLCWTGCRYSDLGELCKANIINLDSGRAFYITQRKTGNDVVIPILPEIENIVKRYEQEGIRPLLNQVFNKVLKQVCRKALLLDKVKIRRTEGGINVTHHMEKCDAISTHTGRRSFATNMYRRRLPSLMIMSITGHKSEAAFLKYIKISMEENAQRMFLILGDWMKMQKKRDNATKSSKSRQKRV